MTERAKSPEIEARAGTQRSDGRSPDVTNRNANAPPRRPRSRRGGDQPYFYVKRRRSWARRYRLFELVFLAVLAAAAAWAWANREALLTYIGL